MPIPFPCPTLLQEENMALKKARIDQEVAILQLQMTQVRCGMLELV